MVSGLPSQIASIFTPKVSSKRVSLDLDSAQTSVIEVSALMEQMSAAMEETSAYLLCFNYPWWEDEHKTKDYDDPAGAKQFLPMMLNS